ncbi:transposase [bacterium]|nr:transposase [bacterium]
MPDDTPRQRKNIRLRDYDYSSPGAYMVTVCAEIRLSVFGALKNGTVDLSEIGRIIEKHWLDLPAHFTGVGLDAWVIMPDHLHGILLFELDGPGEAGLAPTTAPGRGKLPELGDVVGSFKAAVTREMRKSGISPGSLWQRGYYEHVIRNQTDLELAREYIALNPLRKETLNGPFTGPG